MTLDCVLNLQSGHRYPTGENDDGFFGDFIFPADELLGQGVRLYIPGAETAGRGVVETAPEQSRTHLLVVDLFGPGQGGEVLNGLPR